MKDELPRCKECGDYVPQGKELCWCCEHTPKLHPLIPKDRQIIVKKHVAILAKS